MRRYFALLLFCVGAVGAAEFQPVSGYEFLDELTREMQNDSFENPGMPAVWDGEELFNEVREYEEKSCASCHGESGDHLNAKEIARYPMFDEKLGGLVTLQDRINHCWEMNLDRFPLAYDHPDLIALETFVRHQAQGELVNVATDGPIAPFFEQGKKLYQTRFGQIEMSCQHCHDQHQGQMLRGQKLSQGQANGFPEYRLGKGRITSLHTRMRECFISFRADPFEAGSKEYKLLELFVMSRGNGLPIETPAVRF